MCWLCARRLPYGPLPAADAGTGVPQAAGEALDKPMEPVQPDGNIGKPGLPQGKGSNR